MSIFAPHGDSVKLSLTSSSQRITIPALPAADVKALRITQVQGSTNNVFLKLGDGTVTVSTSDGMVVKPFSEDVVVGVADNETHLAILVNAGTATSVIITPGSMIG